MDTYNKFSNDDEGSFTQKPYNENRSVGRRERKMARQEFRAGITTSGEGRSPSSLSDIHYAHIT